MRSWFVPIFPQSIARGTRSLTLIHLTGFTITPDELDRRVRAYLTTHDAEVSKSGWGGFSKTSGLMRQDDSLKWVNPLELKAAAEKAFEEKFGKKEDAKKAQAEKAKKVRPAVALLQLSHLWQLTDGEILCDAQESKAPKASTSTASLPAAESPDDMFKQGWLSRLHKPGGNEQPIAERMKEHLAWTGGKVFTRFPPEPNGFLHVRPTLLSWLPRPRGAGKCLLTGIFLLADRALEGHRGQLRLRQVPQRPLLPPLRRHESRSGRADLLRQDPRERPLARLRAVPDHPLERPLPGTLRPRLLAHQEGLGVHER